MQQKVRNRLVLGLVLFFPAAMFLAAFIFLSEDVPSLPPLPASNGYEDLVKAGSMISNDPSDIDKLDQPQLSQRVSQNATALALARTAMSNQCAVPMQFSTNYIDAHLDDLAGVKRLGLAFAAEGRLAELQNRTNDAAHSYLDAIRLGDDSSRGGALIDELVGLALYQVGARHLQQVVSQLDVQTSREAAAELETLDDQRQTWDDVVLQEQVWSRRTFPGLGYELARIFDRRSLSAVLQSGEKKYIAAEQTQRQLMIALAARAYGLDKGKPPANAADLVPDYLKAIPLDPLTGSQMGLSN
ncbi:MAG TPA: hypothetical protein VGI03_01560 [Verrucomicrobiae bacterium]|jgi:hypothetical protein